MKENLALLNFGWIVLWTIGSTFVQWLIARTRAAKGEITATRIVLEARIETLKAEVECKADREKAERHEAKLTEHDRRIQAAESDIAHRPTLDLYHDLGLAVSEIRGDLKAISEALKTNTELTRRIDNHLFEKGK